MKQYVIVIDYKKAKEVVKNAYNMQVIKALVELFGEAKFNELREG